MNFITKNKLRFIYSLGSIVLTFTVILIITVIVSNTHGVHAIGNRCGINIDPANPLGFPTGATLTGVDWVRIEFKDCTKPADPGTALNESLAEIEGTYNSVFNEYKSNGIKVLLIIDYVSVGDPTNPDNFRRRSAEIAATFSQVDAFEIWNEEDHPRHFPLSVSEYAPLLQAALQGIKDDAGINKPVIVGGLASGFRSYLDSLRATMGPAWSRVDGVAVHPYGKTPPGAPGLGNTGDLDHFMREMYDAGGKPLWVTEAGYDTFTNRSDQATYLTAFHNYIISNISWIPVHTWFCWSDGMVNPFGIVGLDGQTPTVSYNPFFSACGSSATIPQLTGWNLVPRTEDGVSCGYAESETCPPDGLIYPATEKGFCEGDVSPLTGGKYLPPVYDPDCPGKPVNPFFNHNFFGPYVTPSSGSIVPVPIPPPDPSACISFSKSSNTGCIEAAQSVTFTITIQNNCGEEVTINSITDNDSDFTWTLPPGATLANGELYEQSQSKTISANHSNTATLESTTASGETISLTSSASVILNPDACQCIHNVPFYNQRDPAWSCHASEQASWCGITSSAMLLAFGEQQDFAFWGTVDCNDSNEIWECGTTECRACGPTNPADCTDNSGILECGNSYTVGGLINPRHVWNASCQTYAWTSIGARYFTGSSLRNAGGSSDEATYRAAIINNLCNFQKPLVANLDYFADERFSGHYVTIAGIDEINRVVYVNDPEFSEMYTESWDSFWDRVQQRGQAYGNGYQLWVTQ